MTPREFFGRYIYIVVAILFVATVGFLMLTASYVQTTFQEVARTLDKASASPKDRGATSICLDRQGRHVRCSQGPRGGAPSAAAPSARPGEDAERRAKMEAWRRARREARRGQAQKDMARRSAHAPNPAPPSPKREPASAEIARYPTMEAPDRVRGGEEFPVTIWLTEERITPEATLKAGRGARLTKDGKLVIQVPKGRKSWTIELVLFAPGFELAGGKWNSSFRLYKDGDSDQARFRLRARKTGTPVQKRTLRARLYLDGAYLGGISREIAVTGAPAAAAKSAAKGGDTTRPRGATSRTSTISVADAGGAPPADLDVTVLYDRPGALGSGKIYIFSPHFSGGPIVADFTTPPDFPRWLARQYRRFTAAGAAVRRGLKRKGQGEPPSKRKTIRLARDFGRQLYRRYAPAAFKQAFWAAMAKLRAENKRLTSIQITSNNPLIPWELMRPISADGARETDFLGLEFRVARWAPRGSERQLDKPRRTVRVDQVTAIAPRYGGADHLPFQTVELAALRKMKGFREIPGRYEAVETLIRGRPGGIVHFSGHGVLRKDKDGAPSFEIRLADTTLDVGEWRELAARGGSRPFYFFNACDIGQATSVGGFVEGWGPALIGTGASGYIGGLWPLFDRAAANFSTHFYAELGPRAKDGPVFVAEILRRARRLFYETGDPTYLAYIFYGDVNLRFVRD